MKKKSLSLSLYFGGVLIFLLVVFTIVSLIPPKENVVEPPIGNISSAVNLGNNKGSEEDPYYIYDTETFLKFIPEFGGKTKPVREKVQEEKTDDEGNVTFVDVLDENGYATYTEKEGQTEVNHFKFLRDVDFLDISFKTLFNDGTSFIGIIDGDGYSVKNISISVGISNLADFIYLSNSELKGYTSHIAIFGNADGAVIKNISFDAISVNVDAALIPYLKGQNNEFFGNDHQGYIQEFVVGSVVAYAVDTTIQANISATIDSDAYAVYEDNKVAGVNGIGGVVGYAENSTISSYSETENVNINVTMIADGNNRGYYLGGVVGYLYNSTVSNVNANVTISAVSAVNKDSTGSVLYDNGNILYIGGISGFMCASDIKESVINLSVSQVESAHLTTDEVNELTPTDLSKEDETALFNSLFNKVGGVSSIIRIYNETQLSSVSNVVVNSKIDMDCYFGGVSYDVRSSKEDVNRELVLITIKNVITNSDVNTIKVYGISANLYYTSISYTDDFVYADYVTSEGENVNYNIKLTGSTSLSAYLICTNIGNLDMVHTQKMAIKLVYSTEIYDVIQTTSSPDSIYLSLGLFGGAVSA